LAHGLLDFFDAEIILGFSAPVRPSRHAGSFGEADDSSSSKNKLCMLFKLFIDV